MKNRVIGVAALLLLPIFFSFSSATAMYQGLSCQISQPTNNTNGTVTITIKPGQYDSNTRTIRGIIGYTIHIENKGPKEIWYHTSEVQHTFFSHQFGNVTREGNLPSGLGVFEGRIPLLSFHPLLAMTIQVKITNTSTDLTLERSSIELLTTFFIRWTGPESVTGPS